ncbi:MAG: hypothetical protein U1E50_09840 [Caulobacteraceae bacterium]
MSLTPDSAELAPSRDLADYGRKPLFSRGFWAVIALCLFCILAGAGFTRFAPLLFPAKRAPAAAPPRPSAAPPAVGLAAPLETSPARAASPIPADVAALEGRLQRVEATQAGLADAAAAALAAAALSQAAQASGPFEEELAGVERQMPGSPDILALRRLARLGAPSRAALAAEYRAVSQKVAVAANAPGPDAGFLAQAGYALSYIVSVRRVEASPTGQPTALMRFEAQITDGDLESALATLDTLPPQVRERLVAWRTRAERRVEIDRRVAGLRAEALSHLERLTGPPRLAASPVSSAAP